MFRHIKTITKPKLYFKAYKNKNHENKNTQKNKFRNDKNISKLFIE